jgi:glutamate---cysteine ligase / carboxylate-amine ligase
MDDRASSDARRDALAEQVSSGGGPVSAHPPPGGPPSGDAFGLGPAFTIGVEEELLLVTPGTLELRPEGTRLLASMGLDPRAAHGDLYEALIEFASPVCRSACQAVDALAALRNVAGDAGGLLIGAGMHPQSPFGHARHIDAARYRRVAHDMRGLARRTPTCALHVHVGMPDGETAIRACNGLRQHLPLLQALSANSPYWHGVDSGLASARARLFRSAPRSEIPRAFRSYEHYLTTAASVQQAGELPDYTYLWWDVRPHPRLGTVEVRAMDAQSSLRAVAGLAALVHGLARREASRAPDAYDLPHEALAESSFRAARDGLQATLLHDGRLQPVDAIAREAVALARPHARELGSDDALQEIEWILASGGGARRQRDVHASGGMAAVLAQLVAETTTSARRAAS